MARDVPREQDQSIKDRKRLLYEDDDLPVSSAPTVASKPFSVYLNETPAAPLSGGIKAALWAVGIVVGLLLAGAAWKSQRPKEKPKRADITPGAVAMRRIV